MMTQQHARRMTNNDTRITRLVTSPSTLKREQGQLGSYGGIHGPNPSILNFSVYVRIHGSTKPYCVRSLL